MGQSITGIMYLVDNHFNKKNSILKITIILTGTLSSYLLLTEQIIYFMISLTPIILIFALSKVRFKNQSNHSKFQAEIRKLEEKFEHCCD
jgi:hypothetical protein